eukprot:6183560-Pleurochrysis_carterae.AAC.3
MVHENGGASIDDEWVDLRRTEDLCSFGREGSAGHAVTAESIASYNEALSDWTIVDAPDAPDTPRPVDMSWDGVVEYDLRLQPAIPSSHRTHRSYAEALCAGPFGLVPRVSAHQPSRRAPYRRAAVSTACAKPRAARDDLPRWSDVAFAYH